MHFNTIQLSHQSIMSITISSITHTIHRNVGLERHSSAEAYISEAISIQTQYNPRWIRSRTITQQNHKVGGIPDHLSTKSLSKGDSGPSLNGTRVNTIPDHHSTESQKANKQNVQRLKEMRQAQVT